MSQSDNTIRATLDIIFRSGRYGLFPVGTLHTSFGSFACRDKWLETLDEGSYSGTFVIEKICLSGYMTRGDVREQRTFIKAVVCAYVFDSMSDEITESEHDTLADPIFDEGEPEPISQPPVVPQLFTDEPADIVPIADEMTLFIREKLRSVGYNEQWNLGDSIVIPSELDRMDQRRINQHLKANGYTITDPANRLWGIATEVANV